MKCISPKDLASYLVGEVTRSQAEAVDEHLSSCGVCRKEMEDLREMVERIGRQDGQAEERDHLPDIRRRIERGDAGQIPGRRRWPFVAAGGAVVVAIVITVILVLQAVKTDDEFRVKSDQPPATEQDRWAGIQAFSVGAADTPAALEAVHRKSDFLIFTYTNLGESPYDFLMIFAVDGQGRVYWFHPAYTQTGEDPLSIRISKGAERIELKEKVRHDFPEGRLWIYGLFTRKPMKVSSIEQIMKTTAPGARIPLQGSAQQILVTEVEP